MLSFHVTIQEQDASQDEKRLYVCGLCLLGLFFSIQGSIVLIIFTIIGLIIIIIILIIIITRPKPAYGRQGLARSWGQDTDEVSTFLVVLTSHFAPAALSSDLNQPGTINDDKNPPGKPDLEP